MDYVQAVIARLAGNSFLLKGWCLTLTSALLGFAFTRDEWRLAFLGVVAVVAFWCVDTYFLRAERAFRALFRDVAAKSLVGFEMNPANYVKAIRWRAVMLSTTLGLFYGPLALVSIVAIVIVSVPTGVPHPEETPVATVAATLGL